MDKIDNSAPPAPINWGEVRALAMVVGVREAARRMGISEAATMQRSAREGWLATQEARTVNKMAVAQRSSLTAAPCQQLSAGALISSEIIQLGQKTRLSLARGVSKAAETVETLSGSEILDKSGDVKAIAQTADLVHGWKDAAPSVKIRLDVLGGSVEAETVADVTEIESVSASVYDDSVSEDVEDY